MKPEPDTLTALARLIRTERIAHLATLRQGAPMASMTLYLPDEGFTGFQLHVSRLAWHTQDMLADPRVCLSIAATDDGVRNPQVLERVSLRGEAASIPNDAPAHAGLKAAWLARFADSAINFELADFNFFRIVARDARFVAGFGRIHNLSAAEVMKILADGSN